MNADILLHFPKNEDGKFMICFRILNDRFIGKWFFVPFKAKNMMTYLEDWQSWPFLTDDDLINAEKAEKKFKDGKGKKP